MPKIAPKRLDLVERWIRANRLKGRPGEYEIIVQNDREVYRTVSGTVYGLFAVHPADDGWHVTHLKTGKQCGASFSSKEQAERFVFLTHNLTDWRSLSFDTLPLEECWDYCADKPLTTIAQAIILDMLGNFDVVAAPEDAEEKADVLLEEWEGFTEPVQFGSDL